MSAQSPPSASAWAQLQGDAAHTGARSDAPSPPYAATWTARPDVAAGQQLSAPVVSGDTVVVSSPSALVAFGAADGAPAWSVDRNGPPVAPAIGIIDGAAAVIYTDGRGPDTARVQAVDLRTGEAVWTAPPSLKDESRSGVTIADSRAFVGDESGNLYAIDLSDGALAWTASTTGNLAGPVAVGDGVVVAVVAASDADRSAAVVALDESTGREAWNVAPAATATFGSLPSIVGRTAVVAFPAGEVVGLSIDDGSQAWLQRIPALVSPFVAPAASGGSVVLADSNGGVHLVTPGGQPGWLYEFNEPILRSSPVVTSDAVVAGFEDGSIGAVSLDTGHLVFRSSASAGTVDGIALTADAMFVARGGSPHPELVAFATDATGVLVDEASPTAPVAGQLAIGLAVALAVGAMILAPGRVLARRTPIEDPSDAGAQASDVLEDPDSGVDGSRP